MKQIPVKLFPDKPRSTSTLTCREEHLEAVTRILRYLKVTPGHGLIFSKTESRKVQVFSDASFAEELTDRRLLLFVWGNLVTRRSKKQSIVSSSAEAECESLVLTLGICEGMWIQRLLTELKMNHSEQFELQLVDVLTKAFARTAFDELTMYTHQLGSRGSVDCRCLPLLPNQVGIDSSERWACHVKAGPSNDYTKSLRHSAPFCATGPHLGRECALTHSIK
ncbi:hypothetical protein GQ457_08G023680 [Hibiscus cannabinus]